jgi:toxin YoeB
MEIVYSLKAEDDLKFWKKSGNVIIQKKILELINSIKFNPYVGIGKPEPLKYNLSGSWSRRINQEHRIVYDVYEEDDAVLIQSAKGHY